MNETRLESIRNTNPLYLAVKTGKPVDMSAHWNKAGNTKLGNMWTFSTLYGNEEHYVSRIDMKVTGTCGIYCTGCKHACYVRKSYRYGSVIFGHARNTLAIRNDIKKAENEANEILENANKRSAQLMGATKSNLDKMLKSVEDYLTENLHIVRNNREELNGTLFNKRRHSDDED